MSIAYDKNVLILGSSAIDSKFYAKLADRFNCDMFASTYPLTSRAANNPNSTKIFVNSLKNDPEKEVKVYLRALKCIDDALYIIIDFSSASTGLGIELSYLLSNYAKKKYISFIAKEGSKVSPLIVGMYEHITGTKINIGIYKDLEDAVKIIKKSEGYKHFAFDYTN